MKWWSCSAVSAVQYCHCVVHCVANEPSRSVKVSIEGPFLVESAN